MSTDGALCNRHCQKLGIFCPQCSQLLCCECECPHFPEVKTIPLWYINKYLKLSNIQPSSPSQEQINEAKKQLLDAYKEEEARLRLEFTKSVDYLDSYVVKKVELEELKKRLAEMGVNDKGFALFRDLAEKRKPEDLELISGEKSYINYVNRIREKFAKETAVIIQHLNQFMKYCKSPQIKLHYIHDNVLTLVHPYKFTQHKIVLDTKMNANAESVVCMGRIFIIGGDNAGSSTFEVDIDSKSLVPKCSIPISKYKHSLCTYDSNIYSIGGGNYSKNSNSFHDFSANSNISTISLIEDCQRYDINENHWVNMPKLLRPKCSCASFIFNYSHIYASGGVKDNVSEVERISIKEMKAWEEVNLTISVVLPQSIQGIQFNSEEVLIFGKPNYSYILKITDKIVICTQNTNLSAESDFSGTSTPFCDGQFVYCVSNNKKIHRYAIDTRSWSIIN